LRYLNRGGCGLRSQCQRFSRPTPQSFMPPPEYERDEKGGDHDRGCEARCHQAKDYFRFMTVLAPQLREARLVDPEDDLAAGVTLFQVVHRFGRVREILRIRVIASPSPCDLVGNPIRSWL
jgi:hypothetical protein